MAKRGEEDDDKRPSEEDESHEDESEEEEGDEDSSEDSSDEDETDSSADSSEEEDDSSEEDDEPSDQDDADDKAASTALATAGDEQAEIVEEEGVVAAHLGAQRYVYSAFFATMILGGFVLGKTLETIWIRLAVSDWALNNLPAITTVPDESKGTYCFLIAGLVSIVVGLRTFRKPHVRQWAEDVSSELLKVKWPTQKEVYASTVVVLATSAVAVTYLFLLDRFWSFITDKIYGIGS